MHPAEASLPPTAESAIMISRHGFDCMRNLRILPADTLVNGSWMEPKTKCRRSSPRFRSDRRTLPGKHELQPSSSSWSLSVQARPTGAGLGGSPGELKSCEDVLKPLSALAARLKSCPGPAMLRACLIVSGRCRQHRCRLHIPGQSRLGWEPFQIDFVDVSCQA